MAEYKAVIRPEIFGRRHDIIRAPTAYWGLLVYRVENYIEPNINNIAIVYIIIMMYCSIDYTLH